MAFWIFRIFFCRVTYQLLLKIEKKKIYFGTTSKMMLNELSKMTVIKERRKNHARIKKEAYFETK